jgi:heat-inducible transcriptional repressor
MVSDRGLDVLRVIVQDYVSTREPVGSKSIVDRHRFPVSAATIRNDMAALEDEELIAAPHTSSGRIPTDKGYRVFVDQLADLKPLSGAQRRAIETFLSDSLEVDEVLGRTVRMLSQLTHQVAVVQYPSLARARVRHIEVLALAERRILAVVIADTGHVEQTFIDVASAIDDVAIADLREKINAVAVGLDLGEAGRKLGELGETVTGAEESLVAAVLTALAQQLRSHRRDRLVMAGAANLVRSSTDFSAGSVYPLLEALEEQVVLMGLFAEMGVEHRGVAVSIGREHEASGLAETSVLSTGYVAAGGETARLGLLGPTRMDYSGNIAAVQAVATYLTRLFGED